MRQWLMHLEPIWVHGWITSSQELTKVITTQTWEKEFLMIYVITFHHIYINIAKIGSYKNVGVPIFVKLWLSNLQDLITFSNGIQI
jgi:hypothetical protein